jgi:Arc/MetJ-type ribon-helix-helix transcriptional regulator
MKISVSLPDDDVELLDASAQSQGLASRSATVHKAVRLLRASALGADYEQAWSDWADSIDQDLWDRATDDGLR